MKDETKLEFDTYLQTTMNGTKRIVVDVYEIKKTFKKSYFIEMDK